MLEDSTGLVSAGGRKLHENVGCNCSQAVDDTHGSSDLHSLGG